MTQQQFNQANWDAFKRIPLDLKQMWGSTIQSVWRDDCLYVVEADLRVNIMKVKLVYHEENYSDADLRERMHYLLWDLHKLFNEYGICLNITADCKDTNPKCEVFGIINNF